MKIDWEHLTLEELAGVVSEALRRKGIEAILVGGACVTIYSRNRYQSYDLDFATYEDMGKTRTVFEELGFRRKNRYFVRNDCKWFVEFVAPPVAIGEEPIREFALRKSSTGTIKMLRPEDSVKDRLAGYFHWNDRQGLDQAVDICLECNIDISEVERWSRREGFPHKFQHFEKLLGDQRNRSEAQD